jgi:hypothetical protein
MAEWKKRGSGTSASSRQPTPPASEGVPEHATASGSHGRAAEDARNRRLHFMVRMPIAPGERSELSGRGRPAAVRSAN